MAQRNKPELLAPAGDLERLRAALWKLLAAARILKLSRPR